MNRQAVDLDTLAGVLKSRLGPDATVMIAADENASHGAVMNAMLEARKAGQVVTEQPLTDGSIKLTIQVA